MADLESITESTTAPPGAVPKVFVSYSHDSAQHEDRVLGLAMRLRSDGIDATIDQFDTAPRHGWPMWTEAQIQGADFVLVVCTEVYRRRVERREHPGQGRGVLWEAILIYNEIYAKDDGAAKFIPVLFEDRPELVPAPLQGMTRYDLASQHGYEELYRRLTNQPKYWKPALGKLRPVPHRSAVSYPASLAIDAVQPPSTNDLRNRKIILRRVRQDWIEGVLEQSLASVVRVEVGLEKRLQAVDRPINAIVQTAEHAAVRLATGITTAFYDGGEALLVLGAPGAGKTTLLLELARDLLQRAAEDQDYPIPIVFNLSSWSHRRGRLRRWMIDELNLRSDVPRPLAARWIDGERVLPLLDGLDEVDVAHREACAHEINQFRRDHGLLPMVVCSRIADYETLGTKLRLRQAILVQPLTPTQVEDYLTDLGASAKHLRIAVDSDPSLVELLRNPLMLSVATLAYQEEPDTQARDEVPTSWQDQLFSRFVHVMFERAASRKRYRPAMTVHRLSWLATRLIENHFTIFHMEDLGRIVPGGLKWLAVLGTGSVAGLSAGFVAGLTIWLNAVLIVFLTGGPINGVSAGLSAGLSTWQIVGAIVGLMAAGLSVFLDIRPVQFGLTDIRLRLGAALRTTLRVGLSVGLGVGATIGFLPLVSGLIDELGLGQGIGLDLEIVDPSLALIAGLIVGLVAGLTFGLSKLFAVETMETRRSPNQGTRRSITASLLSVALVAGFITLIDAASLKGVWVPDERALIGMLDGLVVWLTFGLIAALAFGGLFAANHLAVRCVLAVVGTAPLDYGSFLDHAARLVFLRKVGGGYIFTHRMVMEYFARAKT